ncbi:hypothetical protein CLAIMM_06635 isoform 1 [Cladophialophora immunda]|nr:hypothetical protein CLAIMM_06635 isoform 1 [Cladophialophora immunda]
MASSEEKTGFDSKVDLDYVGSQSSRAHDTTGTVGLTSAEERRLVRKIDIHLMPVMFLLYLFQYLDKTSLGYTAIMGIVQDAKLVGSQYSWVSSFFYVGFLVASPVAAVALVKFPAAKVVVWTVVIWGGILMCTAAGNNFGSLSILRILLGAFEAAINPGFTMITAMWYKPSEHALRHGIWYAGASIAYIFGGILAYAFSHIHSAVKSWQFLFIIFGAITTLWGIVMYFLLPNNPQTARFLTPEERKLAFARVQGIRHSADTRKWSNAQLKEALIDPRTWLFFLLNVFTTLPGGGLTAFGSIILQSFGYSVYKTQLLTMSQGAFLFLFLLITVSVSALFKNARCYSIALLNLIALAGALMIKLVPASEKVTRLAGLWLISAYASAFPTILSLVSSNICGHTKKAVVNGMLFLGFCTGYIVGPQTFLASESPGYKTAFNVMIACFVLNIAIVLAMRQLMAWWNRKRDQEMGQEGIVMRGEAAADALEQLELDETDWQNKQIRYSL